MESKEFLLSKVNSCVIFVNIAVIAATFLISLLLLIIEISHLVVSTSSLDVWMLTIIKLHHFCHMIIHSIGLVGGGISRNIVRCRPLLRVQHSVKLTILVISRSLRLSRGTPLAFLLFCFHLFKITKFICI